MRLAVALLLFLFATPSPGHEGQNQSKPVDSNGQSTAYASDVEKPAPTITKTSAPVTDSAPHQLHPEPAKQPPPFMSHAEYIMAGLTAVYVVLTGFYVLYSRKTLKELQRQIGLIEKQDVATNRQLEISEKSAVAALQNAQALIASERPWLIIRSRSTGQIGHSHVLHFDAMNYGHSPAEILFSHIEFDFLGRGENLSGVENPWSHIDRYVHAAWVPPGKEHYIGELPLNLHAPALSENTDLMNEIRIGNRWVWCYGIVKYRGLLRNESYTSRFCYLWTPVGGFVMDGPPGYNEYT